MDKKIIILQNLKKTFSHNGKKVLVYILLAAPKYLNYYCIN